MPVTYENIATTTLGSAASTITLSSIPATYTDLRLVVVGAATGVGIHMNAQFNSDTGTNYSVTSLIGTGASAISGRTTSANQMLLSTNQLITTNPAMVTMDILSYRGSTFKTSLNTATNDKNGSGIVLRNVGLWRSTSAITSITLLDTYGGGGQFDVGTTATLYGILRA
jgi:hypothetical protein